MKNEKTELKWYEKKAGLKIKDKINRSEERRVGKEKVCFHHQQFHRMQKT